MEDSTEYLMSANRCARRVREASGLIHSTLPDLAVTVAYVSRKKYVFTRYSLLLSQKGLQALLSLQQPCLYVRVNLISQRPLQAAVSF